MRSAPRPFEDPARGSRRRSALQPARRQRAEDGQRKSPRSPRDIGSSAETWRKAAVSTPTTLGLSPTRSQREPALRIPHPLAAGRIARAVFRTVRTREPRGTKEQGRFSSFGLRSVKSVLRTEPAPTFPTTRVPAAAPSGRLASQPRRIVRCLPSPLASWLASPPTPRGAPRGNGPRHRRTPWPTRSTVSNAGLRPPADRLGQPRRPGEELLPRTGADDGNCRAQQDEIHERYAHPACPRRQSKGEAS